MKYMDIGCNVNCWECTRNCSKKQIMMFSIVLIDLPGVSVVISYKNKEIILNSKNALDFFYFYVIDSLKPQSGLLINQGKNPKEVHEDLMELSVSFYVARLKFIEKLQET